MCGVNGIVVYRNAHERVDLQEIHKTRDFMASRGPDGAGHWLSEDEKVGFGHRRLSIIDLSSAGAQPMQSADGQLVVTFNGEIYNYRALRAELETRGRVFRTQSDTEVLLHLYAEKGEAMVHDLRGMFAFAVWDARKQMLLLARDPYGIKPLYYADDGGTLRFASQVKALTAGGRVSKSPDPAGWAGFYLLGSVPEPFTVYDSIRALPAGSILRVCVTSAPEVKRWFSIAKIYSEASVRNAEATGASAEKTLREALLDSVKHHLVSDVDVGVFLSGGVDSGALIELMKAEGRHDIRTVTVRFEEFSGTIQDEAPSACEIARHYGTRHAVRTVTQAEFLSDLPSVFDAMDQPTIDGVNTWFAAKAASEQGLKVVLSGLGGDELFGGYPSFRDVPRWMRYSRLGKRFPGVARSVRRGLAAVGPERFGLSPKVAGMLELGWNFGGGYLLRRGLFMPWELARVMDVETARAGLDRLGLLESIDSELEACPPSAFAKVATLEASLYMRNQLLRDTDWSSMAHSVEVRVPLVDATLLGEVAPITVNERNGSVCKEQLTSALVDALPSAVVSRAKSGFGIPMEDWLQDAGQPRPRAWRTGFRHWARRWACEIARADW